MEVCVETVTANLFPVEIAVRALYDPADLLVGGNISHDGEDLACEHHTDPGWKITFYCPTVIVVVAVIPAFPVFPLDPFMFLEESSQPVRFLIKILSEFGKVDAEPFSVDAVAAGLRISAEEFLFRVYVLKKCGIAAEKGLQFLHELCFS